MLDLWISTKGNKIIISGLGHLIKEIPGVLQRGLSRSAEDIYHKAFDFLSGPGAKGEYSSGRWKKRKSPVPAGGYPVPVRTGHLRTLLDWLEPGETKIGFGGSFTAGSMEAIVYDSAEYAMDIHEGKRSSKKYGPRRYITDAFEAFNQGGKFEKTLEDEIQKEIRKHGLS